MALLDRQRLFAAKVESTVGTAETLANADGAFNAFDARIQPTIERGRRRGQSAASDIPHVHGARGGTCTLRTDLVGSGTSGSAPLWASTLLEACGFAQSGLVYTPETGGGSAKTLTTGVYLDGRRKILVGTVFDCVINFVSGQPVQMEWNGIGQWGAPTDVALLTPTYPTTIPPRFASATLTVGGTAYKISQCQIAFNNVMTLRPDATDATGIHAGIVVDRDIQFSFDPEASLIADQDWHGDWIAHTEAALAITVGSATGNTIAFAAPKMQIIDVQEGEREGLTTDNVVFQCNRSAAAGDDELSITLT
jgi:hypothetical protein